MKKCNKFFSFLFLCVMNILNFVSPPKAYCQNRESNFQVESIAISEFSVNSISDSLEKLLFDDLINKFRKKTRRTIALSSTMIQNFTNRNFKLSAAFISDSEMIQIGKGYGVSHVLTGVAVKLNNAIQVSIKLLDCNNEISKYASMNYGNPTKRELTKCNAKLIEQLNIKFINKKMISEFKKN